MPAPSMTSEFVALQRAVAGRYSLDRELGRGGMGVVFLARDVALDRLVAIKLLPPALAAVPGLRSRFLQEARTAAGLSHPNIVPIHAVEEHGDLVFFVMSYVDGETLGARVRRAGPLPPDEAVQVLQQIAWALGHAHGHGIIHRDVKPDNVLLERGTGRALVTDFGIAHAADAVDTPRSGVTGTPQYMSPEQARGESVDGRSDLYALGATAFFATTGRLPFEGTSVAGLLAQHAGSPAPSVRSLAPRVSIALAAAVDRCLQKDPAARFPSAEALAGALDAARGMQADVPAPVRAFLKEADAASGEIGTALTAAGASLTVYLAAFGGNDIAAIIFVPAALLLASLGGVRLAQTMAVARDLARQGYDYGAVRPVAALEERAQAVEAAMSPEQRRRARREAALLGAVGAVKTAVFVWLVTLDGPTWLNLIGIAGAIAVPTTAIRHIWNVLRSGKPLWPKLLRSRVGRWLFRVAGLGISGPALPAPVAGEPTAIALGRAAEEVFAALPATQRERLEAVPALIERLQGDVLALRARGESTDGDGRLQTAMVALETLRLDLLRLAAGTGTLDELTQNLEAARRIGEEIDAELGGRREVRDLLR
jgi:hypothetical protein